VLSPGPDTIIIIHYTMSSGNRIGMPTMAGYANCTKRRFLNYWHDFAVLHRRHVVDKYFLEKVYPVP
tara:strand:- start:1735 stop:1935 length:201 start_codon:yes stop_codon:yes gene_type:complete